MPINVRMVFCYLSTHSVLLKMTINDCEAILRVRKVVLVLYQKLLTLKSGKADQPEESDVHHTLIVRKLWL